MREKIIKELKQKLEKEKALIEMELSSFAKKDRKLNGDWNSEYPKINGGVGGQALEDAAEQIREYATRLPIEYDLELKLQNINWALEKIKKKTYGKCEKCQKEISLKRLKACPEARFCLKCKK
jgi:DnaK suppressor protein